jgi:hypothetical protein
MAKSAAERQAAYRQRHLKDIDGTKARLNLLIDQQAKFALERLSLSYAVTKQDLLHRLIIEEQDRLLKEMTPEEQNSYYDSVK